MLGRLVGTKAYLRLYRRSGRPELRSPTSRAARTGLLALLLISHGLDAALASCRDRQPYVPAAGLSCGPYRKVQMSAPSWVCLGLVAGPEAGLRWPRTILQVADDRFIIADASDAPDRWGSRRAGRILSLSLDGNGKPRIETLFDGRSLPAGLALGPDGKVYVGDDGRIWRFDPRRDKPEAEAVIEGLPGKPDRNNRDHWHPFKRMIFDGDGNLLVNFGAPTDKCVAGRGARSPYPCPVSDGAKPDAALWRLAFAWPEGNVTGFAPFARGLRNSMALARDPASDVVLQAENNIDVWGDRSEADAPDEINVIAPGRHYGWPYCAGNGRLTPEYRGRGVRCSQHEEPVLLLPPHAAPLAMSHYRGTLFPELEGKLLIALHGTGESGHRIVAYDVEPDGKPVPAAQQQTPRLPSLAIDGVPKRGVRPMFRPSSLEVARCKDGASCAAGDGAIWIVDDCARSVLVALRSDGGRDKLPERREERSLAPEAVHGDVPVETPPPTGWRTFHGNTLVPRCKACHEAQKAKPEGRQWLAGDARATWRALVAGGLVDAGNVADSQIFREMRGEGRIRMPPDSDEKGYARDRAAIEAFVAGLKP